MERKFGFNLPVWCELNAYGQIVLGTSFFALAIFLAFLLLVFRRYIAERRQALSDERDRLITRSYLERVAGHKVAHPKTWNRKARLEAISRILPLVRGGERTRLLQIAELDGALTDTVRNSHSIYKKERINAIHLLQRFGSEVCIGRLRELMARDPSSRVRLEAAFALAANGSLPPPREVMRLTRAFTRAPTRLDMALLRSVAPLYPEQMVLLLTDEDLDKAWKADLVDALGWSADMSIIAVLETAASDPEPKIRCAALRASGQLGNPVAARWVLPALNDQSSAVTLQAIAACVSLDLRDAVPQLTDLLLEEELWIRLRAEQALEHFAPSNDEMRQAKDSG